ncbi:thioredoxin-disulfide reductase [Lactiplantibacillus modestisalitolerans]|uniref:Thioredoxin reductase n=1 Tax=Lactiplantibacillus modestisalitolerans TaxID=1457219 RepID=A0ABV5WRI8_9LACO|nr:thioredoxin-disulfide reductase [Lactiplantibacillus modestisalitolerans]
MTKQYDVVVIGAGPGGLTAALYASRANLKVAILDRGIYGGQMNNTAEIENYPGFEGIMGPDLAEKMYRSATQFGAEYQYGNVVGVEVDAQGLKHIVTDNDEFVTAAVIIATGSQPRKLGIPGEEAYSGRGVSYCAVCDGAFYRQKQVTVVGGGNSAIEEGLYLANVTDGVQVVHRRDQLRAEQLLQERAFDNERMRFTWHSQVTAIVGDERKVTGVQVYDRQTDQTRTVPTDGVFIYVGAEPMTAMFKNLNITDDAGWILTDEQMQTTIPGIYAIGDVRQKQLRQITTAVGDGGIAGQAVFNYVAQLKHAGVVING